MEQRNRWGCMEALVICIIHIYIYIYIHMYTYSLNLYPIISPWNPDLYLHDIMMLVKSSVLWAPHWVNQQSMLPPCHGLGAASRSRSSAGVGTAVSAWSERRPPGDAKAHPPSAMTCHLGGIRHQKYILNYLGSSVDLQNYDISGVDIHFRPLPLSLRELHARPLKWGT